MEIEQNWIKHTFQQKDEVEDIPSDKYRLTPEDQENNKRNEVIDNHTCKENEDDSSQEYSSGYNSDSFEHDG
eukprot:6109742-Ditylum_brightwellii.AAC.1